MVVVQPVCKGSFLANTTTLYVQTVSTYATWHRHAINVSRLLDSLTGLEVGLASFFFLATVWIIHLAAQSSDGRTETEHLEYPLSPE